MRLELMTYALRKCKKASVSHDGAPTCVDENSSVAPEVAILTDDNRRVEMILSDDLSELLQLWPMLKETARSALLALVRKNAM